MIQHHSQADRLADTTSEANGDIVGDVVGLCAVCLLACLDLLCVALGRFLVLDGETVRREARGEAMTRGYLC